MRSSKSLVLAGIVATAALLIMALGCSDDEPTVAPPTPVDNGIESMLGVVQEQVHQYLDSATEVMESGLEVATIVDVNTEFIGDVFMGSAFPDSTHTVSAWIVSWLTDLQAGQGTMNVVDSLSYLVNNTLSVNARNATAMFVRHNFSYQSEDTTASYTNITHYANLEVQGLQGSLAVITGEFNASVQQKEVSAQSTVWNNWSLEVQAGGLEFEKDGGTWTSGCPNSGTCTVNVVYTRAQDEDIPTTTNWQFEITFTDGNMAVDVTTGQLSTSYEQQLCTL
jgi:hypothetical protein